MNYHRIRQLLAAKIFRIFPNYLTKYDLIEQGQIVVGKLSVHCIGIEFGWIEIIKINTSSGVAEVGHFGVDTSMLLLGIGKAMFKAFFEQLIIKYGCKSVVFINFIPNSDRGLFLIKLGAIPRGRLNSKGYDNFDLLL